MVPMKPAAAPAASAWGRSLIAPPGQGQWMKSEVGFGGYPEYQDRRRKWNDAEPSVDGEADKAKTIRKKLEADIVQLRLLHHIVVHLHKGECKLETAPSPPPPLPGKAETASAATPSLAEASVAPPWAPKLKHLSAEELQTTLEQTGWHGIKEPFTFEEPTQMNSILRTRRELIESAKHHDFQTATVLTDALAAQFGPSMLGEDRHFNEAHGNEMCFTQLNGAGLQEGDVPHKVWHAIPEWIRCSMVVISASPGGSGVAFHKHGIAWLVLHEGVKRWWLYPPSGPPTKEAYEQVALCPSWKLPEVVASLPLEDRPLELIQRPGEGVYTPALWWHATHDTVPTLGIGCQYNMADLDILECHREHPDSAFVLYHVACELHKTDEERAVSLFEEALEREPLNFYFCTNQLLFYLNMVFHPNRTVAIIKRLMRKVLDRLDARRQMIVQRFCVPTVCNFAEWHAPHDRLVRYSAEAIASVWDALMELAGPMLPGGDKFRLTSDLPCLTELRYIAVCSQCGQRGVGKAGQPGSIRAHKFFCDLCTEARERALCGNCGHAGGDGQLGHPGTPFARDWYCATCWNAWRLACCRGLTDEEAIREVHNGRMAATATAAAPPPIAGRAYSADQLLTVAAMPKLVPSTPVAAEVLCASIASATSGYDDVGEAQLQSWEKLSWDLVD